MKILDEFIRTHPAATYHRGRWRALLRNGRQTPMPAALTPVAQAEIA